MTVATRKIILSGLLGIASANVLVATGYAAQPAWVQQMSKPALHEVLGRAIEDDDYNAFATAIKGKPGAGAVTHDQFDALVEAYKLHSRGEDTKAQKQLKQAGIQSPTTT